jgi:hypothetical protein
MQTRRIAVALIAQRQTRRVGVESDMCCDDKNAFEPATGR